MSENMTIDMEKDQDNGQITYANEVISTIVSVATTEVDGISCVSVLHRKAVLGTVFIVRFIKL